MRQPKASTRKRLQVEPRHYEWLSYNERHRWSSYWHQIHEVLLFEPESCLVVGSGERTVSDALRRAGVRTVACDLDPALQPDVVADVRALPFGDGSFDVVLCAQVLEHLPIEELPPCLKELARVSGGRVVISLPQYGRSWEVALRLPFLPRFHRGGTLPARTRQTFDGQHHWEIGARNYPRREIERLIREQAEIERQFVVPDHPYHRFYVLKARG